MFVHSSTFSPIHLEPQQPLFAGAFPPNVCCNPVTQSHANVGHSCFDLAQVAPSRPFDTPRLETSSSAKSDQLRLSCPTHRTRGVPSQQVSPPRRKSPRGRPHESVLFVKFDGD